MTNPQEQFTAAIRTAQNTASEAVQAWASMAQRAAGAMTSVPGSANQSPDEFIDQAFDLIERMLEGQRAMAKSMVATGQRWTEQAQSAGTSLQQRWTETAEQTADAARERASRTASALNSAREQAEAATTAAWERTGSAVEDAMTTARQRTEDMVEAARGATEAMTKPAVEAMGSLTRRA